MLSKLIKRSKVVKKLLVSIGGIPELNLFFKDSHSVSEANDEVISEILIIATILKYAIVFLKIAEL